MTIREDIARELCRQALRADRGAYDKIEFDVGVLWPQFVPNANAVLALLPAQEGEMDIVKSEDAIMQAWLDFDARTGRELAHRGMAEIAAKAVADISPAQEWQTDIENAPKDGGDVLFPIEFVGRAYWDRELKKWVLVFPLHMDFVPNPTRYRLPKLQHAVDVQESGAVIAEERGNQT